MSLEDHSYQLSDALLKQSVALPNGAAAVESDPIDLEAQIGSQTPFLAECEVEIVAPVLTTGELPDTETMTYDVEMDSDSGFGSATTIGTAVLVQTGAGGAGAAAAKARLRLPSDVERYIRLEATNSGAGDASGKAATIQLVF